MREMMLDMMNTGTQPLIRKSGPQRRFNIRSAANIPELGPHEPRIRPVRKQETKPAKIVYARSAVDGDVINVSNADASFAQAVLHRLRRQTRPMLDAAKALLLGG